MNLKSNGHKFPYGSTVHLKYYPEDLGIVENYSSGDNVTTRVYVEFKQHYSDLQDFPNWYREEYLVSGSENPSRRDCMNPSKREKQ